MIVSILKIKQVASSTEELAEIIELLRSLKVKLIAIDEDITFNYELLHFLTSINSFKKKIAKKKQIETIKIAQNKGSYRAKPRRKIPIGFMEYYNQYMDRRNGLKMADLQRLTGMKRATLYNLINDIKRNNILIVKQPSEGNQK